MNNFYKTIVSALTICSVTMCSYGASLPDKSKNAGITGAYRLSTSKADVNSPEGTWVFTFGDNYSSNPVGSYYEIYEATLIDGYLHFINPYDAEIPMVAQYDETSRELNFDMQFLAQTAVSIMTFYIFQCPFIYDYDFDSTVDAAFTATFVPDAQGGKIIFPEDAGIEWAAFDNMIPADENYFATVYIADLENAFQAEVEINDNEDWIDMGNARFMDGWVLPALNIDQTLAENQYEVPMQQYKYDPNLYRLVGPYQAGPAAEFNQCTRKGFIYFDITDPDMVLINPYMIDAGFSSSELKLAEIICYNQLAHFYIRYGITPDIVEMLFPYVPVTTYKDGVITLGYSIDDDGNLVYDANYGDQTLPFGGLQWNNQEGAPCNMTAAIYFPEQGAAVEAIISNMEDIDPVYYNLQGRRVENPQKGSVVIKVAGSKSEKIIVR